MSRICLFALVIAAGCGGQITGPVVYETQSFGDPEAGFPNPSERALFMAANRTRSDPSTVKGPMSKIYPPAAPLALLSDLEHSSRFHATMLATGQAPLMHPSPCTLESNVGTSGCDGDPACGCVGGKTCQSCGTCPDGTDVGTRIGYFHPGSQYGWGEIIAAGYGDPWSTMDGFVDEPDGNDGHRAIVTSASYGVVGFGHAASPAGACWPTFDAGDFSGEKPVTGKIASAAPKPIAGPAGTFRVYATWADPTGAPTSLSAVVDGKCTAMQLELGSPALNSTWYADVALTSGCHAVYVVGTAATGETVTYPSTTAFTIPVAGVACADSLPQPPASCGSAPSSNGDGGASPPDAGTIEAPPDLAPPSAPSVSVTSPQSGATFPAGSAVPIAASASSGVTRVIANWTRFGYTSEYPLTESSPGTWTLSLTVGQAGQRVFTLTATDESGATATTPPVTIDIE